MSTKNLWFTPKLDIKKCKLISLHIPLTRNNAFPTIEMIDDIEKESKDALEELSVNVRSYSDVSCDYIIEHGSKLEAVKNLINLDNSISLLILASNKKDKNPGILVETISGDGYSIPVVVIPGNLSDNDIDKLAGFDNL